MFYNLITTKILIIQKFQIKRMIKVGHGNSWLHLFCDGDYRKDQLVGKCHLVVTNMLDRGKLHC
jgi:hypothetical protein